MATENLLPNACKFSGRPPKARIEVRNGSRREERVYYVRDDGAGFDEAYAEKLFGAFQPLDTQSEFPGIGIGLVTVQGIIQRHGGRVQAQGEPEKGVSFCFTL